VSRKILEVKKFRSIATQETLKIISPKKKKTKGTKIKIRTKH